MSLFASPLYAQRLLAVFFAFLATTNLFAAPPSQEDRIKAEKVFDDVYGSDYNAALTAKDSSTKVTLSKKLRKSADEIAESDPVTALIIREKTVALAAMTTAGYALACELLEQLLPDAANKLPLLVQLVDLKDRIIRAEKAPTAEKASELVGNMKDLASAQLAEKEYTAALKVLERARVLARTYLKTSPETLSEIEGKISNVNQHQRMLTRVQQAEKTLIDKPDDAEANTLVGLAKLLFDQDSVQAERFFANAGNAPLKKLIATISQDKDDLLAIADAYRAAADQKLEKEFKNGLLSQALAHYQNLAETDPSHKEITRVKLIIGQLTTSLGDSATTASADGLNAATRALLAQIKIGVKDKNYNRSVLFGTGKTDYEDIPEKVGILIGLEITYGKFGDSKTIGSFRPIYLYADGKKSTATKTYGPVNGPKVKIEAKSGYAVGTVNVQNGLGVDGLSITFMEITATGLNPKKFYTSDWHGSKDPETATKINRDGNPVIGIYGKIQGNANSTFNAFGLITLERNRLPDLPKKDPPKADPPKKDPQPKDPNELVGGDALKFKPIQFTFDGAARQHGQPVGVLAVGPKVDLMWTADGLYLMREKGKFQTVWRYSESATGSFSSVAFDGKRVWATYVFSNAAPILLVIDPATGKVIDASKAEGLPPCPPPVKSTDFVSDSGPMLMLNTLEAGRVCLAGSFSGRAWVGVATFDVKTGKVAVKVVHDARQAQDASDKEQWTNATVVFRPDMIYPLGIPADGEKAVSKVLVGRMSGPNGAIADHALIVDVNKGTAEVMKDRVWGHPGQACASVEGAIYFVETTLVKELTNHIVRIGPGADKTVLFAGLPHVDGRRILVHGGRFHMAFEHHRPQPPEKGPFTETNPYMLRDTEWWTVGLDGTDSRQVATKLPPLHGIGVSAHYGLVAIVELAPGKQAALYSVLIAEPKK